MQDIGTRHNDGVSAETALQSPSPDECDSETIEELKKRIQDLERAVGNPSAIISASARRMGALERELRPTVRSK